MGNKILQTKDIIQLVPVFTKKMKSMRGKEAIFHYKGFGGDLQEMWDYEGFGIPEFNWENKQYNIYISDVTDECITFNILGEGFKIKLGVKDFIGEHSNSFCIIEKM